jgi:AcrR family transcriptional regulator
VFSEVGYQRGTMSEVARRVGVTEPVVFQNFGTKPAVFAAVLDDATERATAAMRAGVAACGSVGAWLTEFLGPEHLGRDHARGAHAVLFAEAMSHATEPAVKDAIRRTHRTVARTLVDLLARGQREGSVRPGLDPRVCAWWLLSFLASQGFRAAAMPDRSRLEPQLGAMTLQMLTTAER